MALRRVYPDARWDVPTAEELKKLAAEPLPLGLRATEATRTFLRDIYFDTADRALRARGVVCRIRHWADDRRELMVSLPAGAGEADVKRLEAEVAGADYKDMLGGLSVPARTLRAVVDPAALGVEVELETERLARVATGGWWRPSRFDVEYDIVSVRAGGLARSFQELTVRIRDEGRPSVEAVSRAIGDAYKLRSLSLDRRERGEQLRAALESEGLARAVGGGRWVVIAALDGPFIACLTDGKAPRLPAAEGSGEGACRHLMSRALGTSTGELHLVTTVLGEGRMRSLEVWICTRVDRSARPASGSLEWLPIEQVLARAGTDIDDAASLAALATLAKSEVLKRIVSLPSSVSREQPAPVKRPITEPPPVVESREKPLLLDGDLSLIAFNVRVLALAEDESVPLLERVRYLSIVASNLDEFFAVRVGSIKFAGMTNDESDGASPADVRMTRVQRQARELMEAQYACLDRVLPLLAPHGIRLRTIADLSDAERQFARAYFRSTIFPYLTPRAITATPGHPLPIVADRALCFAVSLRATATGPLQLAELAVPTALPRFLQLPDGGGFLPIEDIMRQELAVVYRGRRVEGAHLFRVTRYADLAVDEQRAGNLLQAIEEHARQRRMQPIVRIEVERSMPNAVRTLLLRELLLEPGARAGALGMSDVVDVPGLMDLEALRTIADAPLPALAFPPFRPRRPLATQPSLWEQLRERDVLLHHPYDDFSASVVRFFDEAADDPDVASVKVTLYRAGERSPIVDALRRAADAGKDVTVFVELKARFDEERNVRWTKQLENAGVHVVNGMPGYKNHSKIGLVVRREEEGPRRYVHVGTGNYNASTARIYTDLGLLTTREDICADVNDLFNMLTGSSVPADVAYRECLVAPSSLLTGVVERIDREAAHARAGKPARIRIKVNGLSDREVVSALYRASAAGVDIELVVRGVCTISPGVPGRSERVRVVSTVGRFLEHARIYVFGNGGNPEYFIGSADLRPRNLRRRVEVLVPIHDTGHRARLDEMLDLELGDPTAWELRSDGTYARRTGRAGEQSAQQRFMAGAAEGEVHAPA